MLSIQNKTSETASKYFDTQTVSTENDVYHCLRTQLIIDNYTIKFSSRF